MIVCFGRQIFPRGNRGYGKGSDGVSGAERYFQSVETQDQLRQFQEALRALKIPFVSRLFKKLENRDYLYLKQELAAQVCFQRVTRGSIMFIRKHL